MKQLPHLQEMSAVILWESNVFRSGDPGTGSEDFSLWQVPSCYLIVGNGETSSPLHNPNYDFNDDVLLVVAFSLG